MSAPSGSLAAPIACIAIVGLVLSLSMPLLAFEMEARGISPLWMGLNTAMAGLANIVIAPFVPGLMRRFGFRPLMMAMLVLAAVTLVALKPAPFWLWFPIRFLAGIAIGVLFIVSEYWINAVAPGDRRGIIMGIYATVLSVGFAAGPALLALTGTQGWEPWLIGAAILILSGLPVLLTAGTPPALDKPPAGGFLTSLIAIPAATLAGLVFGAVETSEIAFLPIYGLRIGLTEAAAALLFTAAAVGNIVSQIPLGWLSDRMDRRVLLAGIAGSSALLYMILVPLSASPVAAYVLVFLAGGITGGLYTVGLAHLGAKASGAALAQANAAFVMLYSIGLMAGPPAVGAAMDAANPHGLPAALALILTAYALFVVARLYARPDAP
jgi:MFS family permease